VEADRDPETRETAEAFAVFGPGVDPQIWHLDRQFRKSLGKRDIEAAALLNVPNRRIEQYLNEDPGSTGYRFDLGGGAKLAVVLWPDLLHLMPSGDVAPRMGGFTIRGEIRERTVTQTATRQTLRTLFSRPTWSGRRDSNPRPPPWQGGALPTEPRPRGSSGYQGPRADRKRRQRVPVEPNPPSPRCDPGSSATSTGSTMANGTTKNWAIRSPRRISTFSAGSRFTTAMVISPR
jgi:hypothetical protein